MNASEVAVWSIMVGGLLVIAAASAADLWYSRTIGAVRNLLFILTTGTSCVLVTGLPEVFFPELPARLMMFLKVSLGPLGGAIALTYLGIWLGGMREDALVYRLTSWGGMALLALTLVLAGLGAIVSTEDFRRLLWGAAAVNMAAAVLALIATLRASILGDPLARWMLLACALLAAGLAGVYARGLSVPGLGLGTWALTALCALGYYFIASALVVIRNRNERRLQRLSRLQVGADPATGLPTGSNLLSEAEHVFWRTARTHGQCTVVCLHLRNLYELGQAAGRGVEHQIQVAMAARIRRAAGFRCIVGLYHPRCFVVVISADPKNVYVDATVTRLRQLVAQPLSVVGANQARHDFMPQLGVGVVTVNPAETKPLESINEAERMALGPKLGSGRTNRAQPATTTQDLIATRW